MAVSKKTEKETEDLVLDEEVVEKVKKPRKKRTKKAAKEELPVNNNNITDWRAALIKKGKKAGGNLDQDQIFNYMSKYQVSDDDLMNLIDYVREQGITVTEIDNDIIDDELPDDEEIDEDLINEITEESDMEAKVKKVKKTAKKKAAKK